MKFYAALIACFLFAALSASSFANAGQKGLNPVTVKKPATHKPVPLFSDGVAKATICLMDEKPSRATMTAVKELQTCIKLAGGAELPVSKGELIDGPAIVIGNSPEVKAVTGLDGSAMPIEGFAIKTAENRVFIAGNDDPATQSSGTAWGIYEFLERVVGVRWYWPAQHGGRSVVNRTDLSVAPLWIEDAPVFRMRTIWPSNHPGLGALHASLRSANTWPVKLVVHAPHGWGKNEDFVKNRPEVFQLSKDGKRANIMLCYGNKRTLETYLELIEKHYDKGEKVDLGIVGDAITVSPWDAEVACYCEDCRALWDENGGSYGTASRILETFVAKLAREVKKRWPDKTIIYLPYMNYTMASGTVQFPDNVEVQLCGMPGLALYKEPAIRKQFQDNIDKWRELTGRKVQTWEYSCWPEDRVQAPYHYPHVIQSYYQENKDKIVGSFINGVKDHWPRSNWSLYCWLKCLWNPDFDVDAAAEEFCERMFGPASGPMKELLDLQISRWEDSRFPSGALSAEGVYSEAFPPAMVKKMTGLLDQARELAADDPLVMQRLEYYSTPFPGFIKEYEYVVEGKGMNPLLMKKTGEMPVVDGKLDDKEWEKAPEASLRVYNGKEKKAVDPKFPTTVRALWNTDGLMLGLRMDEPNPAALVKDLANHDDGTLYWQDCVELFLDTSGKNSGKSYHLILTAGGAVYDAFGGDLAWECEGLEFKTHEGEDFWSMEVFIPHKSVGAEVTTDSTGRIWYGQICRHRLSDKKGGRENQKLNANQGGFNSNTGDFAEFRFVE